MRDTLTSQIRFSIIITSYNQRAFIKDAVDSAIGQQNPAAEVIVVDDASTDGSQEILRQYGDAIRLICRETNRKCSVARNCGAAVAAGDYLVFLDGDDALVPWTLDVYEQIVKGKNPKMIVASIRHFQGMLPVLQKEDRPRTIQVVEYVDYLSKDRTAATTASAMVIERRVFEAVGGWPEEIWPMADHDFMLKLGDCGRMVLILAPATTLYRVHTQNIVRNVPAFLPSIKTVIRYERLGKYPGGKRRRFQRWALIGGYALDWGKKGVKIGMWWDALKLNADVWPMALAALTRKLWFNIKGRKPFERLEI